MVEPTAGQRPAIGRLTAGQRPALKPGANYYESPLRFRMIHLFSRFDQKKASYDPLDKTIFLSKVPVRSRRDSFELIYSRFALPRQDQDSSAVIVLELFVSRLRKERLFGDCVLFWIAWSRFRYLSVCFRGCAQIRSRVLFVPLNFAL